mgnify:CR=1 FL=1
MNNENIIEKQKTDVNNPELDERDTEVEMTVEEETTYQKNSNCYAYFCVLNNVDTIEEFKDMTYKEEFITFMVRSGVLTFGAADRAFWASAVRAASLARHRADLWHPSVMICM